uniref:Transmembrane protein 170B n=56 Tax=Neognathae TaxID=8825 RepID=A0A8C3DGA5_CORMO
LFNTLLANASFFGGPRHPQSSALSLSQIVIPNSGSPFGGRSPRPPAPPAAPARGRSPAPSAPAPAAPLPLPFPLLPPPPLRQRLAPGASPLPLLLPHGAARLRDGPRPPRPRPGDAGDRGDDAAGEAVAAAADGGGGGGGDDDDDDDDGLRCPALPLSVGEAPAAGSPPPPRLPGSPRPPPPPLRPRCLHRGAELPSPPPRPLAPRRRRLPPAPRSGGRRTPPGGGTMKVEAGDNSMINLSVQQVLSLWAHGTVLRSLTEMWYWVFLWALFSSLFVHGAVGVLMFVMLQRHRQGRLISVIVVSIGFLGSVTGAMITSAAVAGIYRVAGKNMAPLEALVFGVGQTVLTLIISFSRILATL